MMKNPQKINMMELMEFYNYKGKIGEIKLMYRLFRSWVLQSLALISPIPSISVTFQRARGVKIGRNVYIGPNTFIDLIYPQLITIEDYVSIGFSMIFAHANPTYSIYLKKKYYPRKVSPVVIKRGAWIAPGNIILCGVTIGENSIVGAGSVVTKDVEPYTVVAGTPAKIIKKLL